MTEDEVLLSGLGEIPGGFYIDVGAGDPFEDSMTRVLYDRGWRGVNIEPRLEAFQRLKQHRPRDVSLHGVASEVSGEVLFYEIGLPGGAVSEFGRVDSTSSLVPAKAASALEHKRPVNPVLIRSYTLDEIFGYRADFQTPADVHFLKIDVEDAEPQVIAGWNSRLYRPWALCIEADDPHKHKWESRLTGYNFVGTFAVNRYYVAAERGIRFEGLTP